MVQIIFMVIFYVQIVDSIVSIFTFYFDFAHRLSRLNLIVLWCFVIDGIIILPITSTPRILAQTTAFDHLQGNYRDDSRSDALIQPTFSSISILL